MRSKEVKKVIRLAERVDWNATYESGSFEFQKSSPAGQDFNISIEAETIYELRDKLYERHSDFDCSEEAYLWLDESGHGKNGAPYDMKDLYEDMEACREMILELVDVMKEE